jgi:lysophospholipase L1-like esterase
MRRILTRVLPAAILALMVTACTGTAKPVHPLISSGDRMVFLGDSITEQRIYTRYVMNYFTLCAPGAKIFFRNAGWSGDTAPGGLQRLKRDVLDLKPTVVSICFGMNDARYIPFNQEAFDAYMKGMKGLVEELKKAHVKVVLLSPGIVEITVIPDFIHTHYNEALGKFAEGVMKLGEEENVPAYNLHELMMDVQIRGKKDNSKFCMIDDGVHPNQIGHVVMAYALLRMLAPQGVVCAAHINAKNQSIKTANCRVSNLKVAADRESITFTRSDQVLPAYIEPEGLAALKYVPYYADLNPYTLTVTRLEPGNWKLTVGGDTVGTFSADQLAEGVELATLPGPWLAIGKDVDNLSAEQEDLYIKRWRNVSLAEIPAGKEQERADNLKKLDAEIDAKEAARIDRASGVHKWNWSLVKVP